MIKAFIKIALRSLLKDKSTTILNALGLIIGMSSFAIIFLFVAHELSYDKFHKNADNIYRITTYVTQSDQESKWAITNGYLVPLLKEKVPEVKTAIKLRITHSKHVVRVDEKIFTVPEGTGFFADPEFFEVFDFGLLYGDQESALQEPNSIVLNEKLAKKYFGKIDVIGQTIIWKDSGDEEKPDEVQDYPLKVTGVIKNIPQNSHIQFDFLISGTIIPGWYGGWGEDPKRGYFPFYVYFVTHPNIDEKIMQAKIQKVTEEPYAFMRERILHTTNLRFPVQKLKDIYFNANNLFEHTPGGNLNFVRIFIVVGILIIIIASINSIILNTAKSLQRLKEIGVRKTLGSSNANLMVYFMTESVALNLIVTLISIGLVELILQTIMPRWYEIQLSLFTRPDFIVLLIAVGLIMGLVSGLFVALKYIILNPADALQGRLNQKGKHTYRVRNSLVMIQFVITSVLIAGSIVIFRQIDYLNNKELGYHKDLVINIHRSYESGSARFNTFKEKIKNETDVKGAGLTLYEWISDYNASLTQVMDNESGDTLSTRMQWNAIDYDLIPMLGLEITEGRNFSPEFSTDSTAVIINETAKHALGLDKAVGAWLVGGNIYNILSGNRNDVKIIGVVKDFHYQAFRKKILPTMLVLLQQSYWQENLLVRIKANKLHDGLSTLEARWRESGFLSPFEYTFLDDWFAQLIEKETQLSAIVTTFTVLSIIVASLGLVGLIGYTVERKKREIGIRKVFGASFENILILINRRFLELMIVAFAVSIPLSFSLINNWLENFAYKIEIRVADYLLTGMIVFTLAILTISIRALRAVGLNPAEVLKEE